MGSAAEMEARKLELEIEKLEHESTDWQLAQDRFDQGRFTFFGEVSESSVYSMMAKLNVWTLSHPGKPIEIVLNSPGGSCTDGLALVDYLDRLRKEGHHVTITGYGTVASMAASILQAADDRVLSKHAWLTIHEVSSGVRGTSTEQEDHLNFIRKLQAQNEALLCERSDLTPRRLRAMWKRKDVYLSPAEALKLGLIDRIEE